MIRNQKTFGLTFAAVLVISAMAVSAASADKFAADKYPVTLTGSQIEVDQLSTTAGTVQCETVTYHGTLAGAGQTEFTMKPSYGNCTVGLNPAVIDMNTCGYTFTVNPAKGKTSGSIHIECTKAGDDITVTTGDAPGQNKTTKCTLHIPQQTLDGVTYIPIGTGATREIEVYILSTGVTYTETAGSGLGACANSTEQHNGNFTGKLKITGEEDPAGANIGLFLIEE